ncbi:hypothetical protein DPMN_166138 [Dreissena polymorpha]|uniref:Uncharacterized protein n=1 Tax=Dreissena polymorpha TaxID=45954 RepID=A0A9D4F1P4_DREPO|nr:hypothetical protein DPMN_166138 [Dreissena polymorpha]
MFLVAVNNVDKVEQMITSTSFMKITWLDMFMTWTPANFSGISIIEWDHEHRGSPKCYLETRFSFSKCICNDNRTWYPVNVPHNNLRRSNHMTTVSGFQKHVHA